MVKIVIRLRKHGQNKTKKIKGKFNSSTDINSIPPL